MKSASVIVFLAALVSLRVVAGPETTTRSIDARVEHTAGRPIASAGAAGHAWMATPLDQPAIFYRPLRRGLR